MTSPDLNKNLPLYGGKIKMEADWGIISEKFDEIKDIVSNKDLSIESEAQTRFDVIDRIIKEVLLWKHGQIKVEEHTEGKRVGFVDYILRSNNQIIVIEAKKIGATFPSPTKKRKLKLTGSVLGADEIAKAIRQADKYARNKKATIVIITNGLCWCCYSLKDKDIKNIYATLIFPFSIEGEAEYLFNLFYSQNVEDGSLESVTNEKPLILERKLIFEVHDADARIDRNNIADHIAPALNNALYAESLLNNKEQLERCFVVTEARIKFDNMLGIYLTDSKPSTISAKRISKKKSSDSLKNIVQVATPSYAPPVTLIIGQVGAGKSTYLRHFELVTGEEILKEMKIHWIYIDFESMGEGDKPREFIYKELRKYLLTNHIDNPINYSKVVEPAYHEEIAGLARGPYALLYSSDKKGFKKIITEHIMNDLEKVEPYVDKLLNYISRNNLCVVVLDNIDLYENEELETKVFSEGLALSKRIHCNIIVSIRDRTYIHHRYDSAFDAYELRKLWLDPPPVKEVLSRRFSYSKKLLEGKKTQITLSNLMKLNIPDLSVFFEIVKKSILTGKAGDFIDAISDTNIRKGLILVVNFLTSGHIHADKAIKNYIEGKTRYTFPFHEIFKGSILGQWKYYKEERAEGINLFDYKFGIGYSRLLRIMLLRYFCYLARSKSTQEISVLNCIEIFTKMGISENKILACLNDLYKSGLIRSIEAKDIDLNSQIVIARRGGYYIKYLCHSFPYVEVCMYDTAIEDNNVWEELLEYTHLVESESNIPKRMEIRKERIICFLDYLINIEKECLNLLRGYKDLGCLGDIKQSVTVQVDSAIEKSYRWYGEDK